ncbi:MAG: septum formation initiator family protein [Actinomycetota bacterium]|nr:septum formation initiator family protein [Actinomycetota bacterium]
MSNNVKIVSRLSRKTKINIIIVLFLIFIIVVVLTSINQIKDIIEKKEKVAELEEKLNWYRNENIRLLALEKSLYEEEAIELEARKQFNMTSGDELNVSVLVKDDPSAEGSENSTGSSSEKETYSDSDLWGNLKIFYNNEIKEN